MKIGYTIVNQNTISCLSELVHCRRWIFGIVKFSSNDIILRGRKTKTAYFLTSNYNAQCQSCMDYLFYTASIERVWAIMLAEQHLHRNPHTLSQVIISSQAWFSPRSLLVPKITNSNFTYDVPDDGSTKTTFSCRATGFPRPKIQWKFENISLPAGNAYFVNTTDIPGANLTASNDGGLEVTSGNRHGGFGVTVVCFANNTNGNTERNFLVRFLKGIKELG